ncbi:MAG: hypothetical protein ACKOCJ_02980 [Burkholderiaceae bacterium]
MLVLTTGRRYCERFLQRLPVVILPCPVAFPPMNPCLLWRARSHGAAAARWLREHIRSVATKAD